MHEIAPYIAIAVMIKYGGERNALHACLFLILIDSINIWHNSYLVIDNPLLMISFSLISLIFARLSLKSSVLVISSYFAFSIAYFLLGLEDKISRGGILDSHFYEIMYGLLIMLVLSVTYDRMGGIKLRTDRALS